MEQLFLLLLRFSEIFFKLIAVGINMDFLQCFLIQQKL